MQNGPSGRNPQQDDLLLGQNSEAILLRTSWIIIVGVTVLMLLPGQRSWPITVDNVSTYLHLVLAFVAWVLARQGHGRLAAVCLTAGLMLIQVFNATQVAGARTPGLLIALPVTVTIAAWLGGLRAAVSIAALAVLSTAGLMVAEANHLLTPTVDRPSLTYGTILIIGILLTLAVQYGSLQAFNRQFQQVRQSEARNVALMHGNPIPISTLDASSRFVEVNDAWLHAMGRERDHVIGRTSAELGLWRDQSARENFIGLMQSSDSVIAYPAWLLAKGSATLFHIYAARILVGNERNFAVTLLDQSDRLAAENAQKEVQERLESSVQARTAELRKTISALESTQSALVQSEKLASLGALVAGVAHELNTPIGTILTLASTVQENVTDLQHKADRDALRKSELSSFLTQQRDMADVLERNARRSADLISSFKQIAVDRTSERQRVYQLRELVFDTQRSLQPSLRGQDIHFTLDIPEHITCDGYPGAVSQILTNLIQNAAVHAFNNQTGEVRVRAHVTDMDRVVLEVEDNGKGMDGPTARKVFDPFFTTRMGQGGSGLGLSVAYNLATGTLQGTLSVQSTPGQGSCFRLEFPQHLRATSSDPHWHPAL